MLCVRCNFLGFVFNYACLFSVIEKLYQIDYVDAIAAGMWAVGIGSLDRFKTANVILPNLIDVHWSDLQLKLKANRADK